MHIRNRTLRGAGGESGAVSVSFKGTVPDKIGEDVEQAVHDRNVAAGHDRAGHLGRRGDGAVQVGQLRPQRVVRELCLEGGRRRCTRTATAPAAIAIAVPALSGCRGPRGAAERLGCDGGDPREVIGQDSGENGRDEKVGLARVVVVDQVAQLVHPRRKKKVGRSGGRARVVRAKWVGARGESKVGGQRVVRAKWVGARSKSQVGGRAW